MIGPCQKVPSNDKPYRTKCLIFLIPSVFSFSSWSPQRITIMGWGIFPPPARLRGFSLIFSRPALFNPSLTFLVSWAHCLARLFFIFFCWSPRSLLECDEEWTLQTSTCPFFYLGPPRFSCFLCSLYEESGSVFIFFPYFRGMTIISFVLPDGLLSPIVGADGSSLWVH